MSKRGRFRKLARLRPPALPFVSFSVSERLKRALATFVDHSPPTPIVWFRDRPTLACIYVEEKPPLIEVHEILNIRELPVWVFDHILLHELIHLIVRPRRVDGRMRSHPPEFWELEEKSSPLRKGRDGMAVRLIPV